MQYFSKVGKILITVGFIAPVLLVVSIFFSPSHELPKGQLPLPKTDIIEITPGLKAIKGVLLVFLKPEVPDPEAAIKSIATQTSGRIYGSLPEIHLYTLYYEVSDMKMLESIKSKLLEYTEVDLVTFDITVSSEQSLSKTQKPSLSRVSVTGWEVRFKNWGLEHIKATQAWTKLPNATKDRTYPKIAVIDGAIYSNHRNLKSNLSKIVDPGNGLQKHGTHVTGIIAAVERRGGGSSTSGICPECSVSFYSYYGPDGSSDLRITLWRMVMAVLDGAQVVNMSLAIEETGNEQACNVVPNKQLESFIQETNNAFHKTITYLRKNYRDTLWVVSAGNECRDAKFTSPASLAALDSSPVISVASISENGKLSSFSNFGRSVSVAAPGENIYSTVPCSKILCAFGDYDYDSGTSMAAPHVAGVAALVLAAHPDVSITQLKDCIIQSAVNQRIPGQLFGAVDALGAVTCSNTKTEKPIQNQNSPLKTSSTERNDFFAQFNGFVTKIVTISYQPLSWDYYLSSSSPEERARWHYSLRLYTDSQQVFEENLRVSSSVLAEYQELISSDFCKKNHDPLVVNRFTICESAAREIAGMVKNRIRTFDSLEKPPIPNFDSLRAWRLHTRAYVYKYPLHRLSVSNIRDFSQEEMNTLIDCQYVEAMIVKEMFKFSPQTPHQCSST